MSAERGVSLRDCLRDFPRAMLVLSTDGVVLDSNGRLERIVGRDLVGRPFAEALDPTSQRKWSRLLSGAEVEAEPAPLELVLEGRETLELRTFLPLWGEEAARRRLWLIEYVRDPRFERLQEELAATNSELVTIQRELAKERDRLARTLVREETARAEAERRAREEAALRRATTAMNAAFTVDDVVRQIADHAAEATEADGRFVERIDIERNRIEVVAAAGAQVPPLGVRLPYTGSFTELVVDSREPVMIPDLGRAERPLSGGLERTCSGCSAVVAPLCDAEEAFGALFLLRRPGRPVFHRDETERARTFGTLANLALRKVHLLEESERRRLELQRLLESRSRLMRGFSHDVKNPLGAADGHAQLLEMGLKGELTRDQQESIGRIRRSIGSALELIDELTQLARAEAGQIEIERQAVDCRAAASEAAEEFRAAAEAAGITLVSRIADQLPLIESDGGRIRQILGNLLSNAVKYTPEGGRVTLAVELATGGQAPGPGRWVAIAVSDTGPGIPEEKQHLLFREFVRIAPGAEPGAGLGLAISRRLARLLGGDITVESEPGRGSTFTLWLPLREAGSTTA